MLNMDVKKFARYVFYGICALLTILSIVCVIKNANSEYITNAIGMSLTWLIIVGLSGFAIFITWAFDDY